ncbi:MAG: extracellular solute-binding protein [Oscillospiraceae bacterium]|nr:extracellular solute-binding protein [Oscillospiraceae bacterium]
MKKYVAMLLALAMLLGLMAGCGGSAAQTETSGSEAVSSAVEAEEPADEDNEAPEDTAEVPEIPEEAASAEDAEEVVVEKGPFEAPAAELPLADGAKLTYFCELPGYMSMFNVNSYDDTDTFKYVEEATGVDVEFTIVNNESYQQNFQLMVASGDITDMVAGASQQYNSMAQMIEDGVALDLMEYQDYLPNFWNALNYYDNYKTIAITQDGTMPEIICIADDYKVQSGMQIRQDWLDKLGMEIPGTPDELHDVLAAFVSECGADHALLLTGSTQLTGTGIVGGFGTVGYDPNSTSNMYVVDGVVKNGFLDEAYKDYMEMMAQWYAEGLIASDFATESNDPFTSNADAYISGGNAGVWSSMSDNMDSNMVSGKELNPDYNISPMAQPMLNKGDIFHFGDSRVGASAMGKSIAISDCCEDVELACAWIDFFFSDEGIKLANYGLEGVSWNYNDAGEPELDFAKLTDGFPMISFGMTYYTLACVATLQDFDRQFGAYSEANIAAMELWTETSDDLYTLPTQVELTYEESQEYSDIWSDLSTYANTEIFKFVMGEYNFDSDWENFISTLKDMGVENAVEIYQGAYDRYIEAYGL